MIKGNNESLSLRERVSEKLERQRQMTVISKLSFVILLLERADRVRGEDE